MGAPDFRGVFFDQLTSCYHKARVSIFSMVIYSMMLLMSRIQKKRFQYV